MLCYNINVLSLKFHLRFGSYGKNEIFVKWVSTPHLYPTPVDSPRSVWVSILFSSRRLVQCSGSNSYTSSTELNVTYYKPKQTIKTITHQVMYGARVVILKDNTKAVMPYGSTVIIPLDKFLTNRDFSHQTI